MKKVFNFFSSILVKIIGITASLFTILTFYYWIFNRDIDFSYTIVTDVDVFDINANEVKLNIYFDTINISKENHSLKILEIVVSNTGNKTLLPEFYISQNVGFLVENGSIIDYPEITDVSNNNEYLIEGMKNFCFLKNDSIKLPKLSLDGGEYYTMKIYISYLKTNTPTLIPFGKIAGVNKIKTIKKLPKIKRPDSVIYLGIEFNKKVFWITVIINSLISIAFYVMLFWPSNDISNKDIVKLKRDFIQKFAGKRFLTFEEVNNILKKSIGIKLDEDT